MPRGRRGPFPIAPPAAAPPSEGPGTAIPAAGIAAPRSKRSSRLTAVRSLARRALTQDRHETRRGEGAWLSAAPRAVGACGGSGPPAKGTQKPGMTVALGSGPSGPGGGGGGESCGGRSGRDGEVALTAERAETAAARGEPCGGGLGQKLTVRGYVRYKLAKRELLTFLSPTEAQIYRLLKPLSRPPLRP